jgi:hypothetical protein
MPIKNFFFSPLSLTPPCSNQSLYHSCKTPLHPSQLVTSILLNCIFYIPQFPTSLSSMMSNCRTLWAYNRLPSEPYSHLELLGHFGHLGHLSYLNHLNHLNTLDPYS